MTSHDAVIFDIDGVLATSWEPIPGAAEAVAAIRVAGLPVRFVTNTTSKSGSEIVAALRGCGVSLKPDELITASIATGMYVSAAHPGASVMVLDEGSDDDLLRFGIASVDRDDVDVVIVGSGGPSLTWDRLNLALRSLLHGAALVGMNGGLSWKAKEGVCLDGGSYVSLLSHASDCEPTIAGKPSPTMFSLACSSLSMRPGRVLMVGDDIVVDIEGAQNSGMEAVLVRTGKFRSSDLDHPRIVPNKIVNSVADVVGLLGL